ncbi:MAG: type II toxin-antitoxin system RelE/ParE family toxin [Aminivibrio sp.]|jgi:putative addiction module killer protein
MNIFMRTQAFDRWLKKLKDPAAKARILVRIRSAEAGNFGDCEPVGDGVYEMRIHAGPGYRIYYFRQGAVLYILLCGGDKSSQKKDISAAKAMKKRMEEEPWTE